MELNSAGKLLRCIKYFNPTAIYSVEVMRVLRGLDPQKKGPLNRKSVEDVDRIRDACIAIRELQVMYEEFIIDMQENYPIAQQRQSILIGLESLRKWVYPAHIDSQVPQLDGSVFALLDVCAKGLPVENEISKTEFDDLRVSLQSLRELTGTVKPALRKVLLELIRISEDAISKYETRGASGMKKALKEMWGEMAEIWRVETPEPQDEAEKATVCQTVWAFVLKFDAVYARAVKYRALLEYVPLLLNGPSQDSAG